MNFVIETKRLGLRPWTPQDRDAVLHIYSKPEVVRYLGKTSAAKTLEDADAFLKRRQDHDEAEGFCLWAAIERASGQLVGACGLQRLDGGPKVEVGYHFDSSCWGQGYASEGAFACVDYAFEILNLDCLYGIVDPENGASRRVLEKAGLRYFGEAIYYEKNVVELALPKAQWEKGKQK